MQPLEELGEMDGTGLVSKIALSIKILIDLLVRANHEMCQEASIHHIFRGYWPLFHKGLIPRMRTPPAATMLKRRLVEMGWSPLQVNLFSQSCSSSTMYYLSSLKEPGTAGRDHALCEEDKCLANSVSFDEYQTKHISTPPGEEPCNCSNLGFASSEVAAIIKDGGVPLVQ